MVLRSPYFVACVHWQYQSVATSESLTLQAVKFWRKVPWTFCKDYKSISLFAENAIAFGYMPRKYFELRSRFEQGQLRKDTWKFRFINYIQKFVKNWFCQNFDFFFQNLRNESIEFRSKQNKEILWLVFEDKNATKTEHFGSRHTPNPCTLKVIFEEIHQREKWQNFSWKLQRYAKNILEDITKVLQYSSTHTTPDYMGCYWDIGFHSQRSREENFQ